MGESRCRGSEAKPDENRSEPEAKPEEPAPLVVSADKVASRYHNGGLTAEKILKWLKAQNISETQRGRFRELLEERNVPLAETERKMNEEAKRKKEAEAEARRKAAEEAKRRAAEEEKRKAAEEVKLRAAEEALRKRIREEELQAIEREKLRKQQEADNAMRQQLESIQKLNRLCLPLPSFSGAVDALRALDAEAADAARAGKAFHATFRIDAGDGVEGDVVFANVAGHAQIFRPGENRPEASVPVEWDECFGLWPTLYAAAERLTELAGKDGEK